MGRGRLSVSFDLDGTLTTSSFVDSVWLEGLPSLVAEKRGIGFPEALRLCIEAYNGVGDDSLLWYRLPHWLDHFGLDGVDPEAFIRGYAHRLELFDDVLPVLDTLRGQGHELILFSNAARHFLDVEVSKGGLEPFFTTMISVSDDWGTVKSDPAAFVRLKGMAGPDLVHVGDHAKFDFMVPRSVGIPSYLVCRDPAARTNGSLASLHEFLAAVGRS
ncbi:MAG TPA: HAD-IA family hydrolase [Deltaproteobacteria bacterium]|jgi:putative hydrolase of the HAD superfamily|nr:HAD-IA family hydrolase [Deltaproteobacteria bacterium]HOI07483.1 HAD-IA family hydrolase [Deltaproteobacteria bacterium]